MQFAQIFILAIVVTASAVLVTAIIAAQEFQARKAQKRRQDRVFAPAASLLHDDDGQALGSNPELLYAIRRLG